MKSLFPLVKSIVKIEMKNDQVVDEEVVVVHLTFGQDDGHLNRRLIDFILHDENGTPQRLEMNEVNDLFIFGLVLLLEENTDKSFLGCA